MSKFKTTASALIATSFIAVILAIPVPWWIHSSFLIEPHNVQHVYSLSSGHLESVEVAPGEMVSRGDVLIVLSNEDLEDEKRKLSQQLKLAQSQRKTGLALNSPDEVSIAEQRIAAIEGQVRLIEEQLEHLIIKAPVSGRVVSAEAVAEPTSSMSEETRLHSWHGTIFKQRNQQAFVEQATHLLSIAPDDDMQAVLLVSQDVRNELQVGTPVLLRSYHLPDHKYEAVVTKIADRQSEFAPAALSNKHGGDLSTVTDQQGREKLAEIAYQATVKLTENTELMRTGLRGRARFIVDKRSLGGWFWRYILQTFHFRL